MSGRDRTHVCLDCGALGYAGGYHDHGGGNAGETIPLSSLPIVIRSFQKIEQLAEALWEIRDACEPDDPIFSTAATALVSLTPEARPTSVVPCDADRWVNASITVLIPLDVPVTASKWEKQEAAGDAMERLIEALPADMQQYVLSGRWEDSGS